MDIYIFGLSEFHKKSYDDWHEINTMNESVCFKYKEIYHDNDLKVLEDKNRDIQLKLYTNPKEIKVLISTGMNEFGKLYSNGSIKKEQTFDILKHNIEPQVQTKGSKKIALMALATPNMREMTNVSYANHKHYAKKFDYSYFTYFDSMVDINFVTWNKVFALKKHLQEYDYLIWIDADAIITNMNISIESIIEKQPNKSLYVCDDIGGWRLNTGVMIWKNTEWSQNIIEKWTKMEKLKHNQGAEQQQLIHLLRKEDNNCSNWHVFNRHEFNTHPKEHKGGDFILHMMGLSGHERIKTFKYWNSQLKVIS